MPLIGTAGHVDHGKSTLLQALTGRDPDRLDEEKARGLTIDLGFAWADLGTGEEVSFVDVPGHERYLKNMLAGIDAIDTALLVIDAREGWKPQTEEHVAVLSLLGIGSGVVAITKVDTVDSDTVELAILEAGERLVGTTLEGSPILPVSAVSGHGLDELRLALLERVKESHRQRGPARLWVDRVFSIVGTGTVVTGSLLGGQLDVGGELSAYPGDQRVRIRTIQSHERSADRAQPGFRVALGLTGATVDDLPRGTMLARPGTYRGTSRFVIDYRLARYVDDLSERGAYQIHVGTATRNVRFQQTGGRLAVVSTPQPVPVVVGDRFIIRDTGRRLVVAGGRVVDPQPGRHPVQLEEMGVDPDAHADTIADQLLVARRSDLLTNLEIDSGGGLPSTGVQILGTVYTEAAYAELQSDVATRVLEFHRDHPLRDGIPLATLADQVHLDRDVAEHVVSRSDLVLTGPVVASADHNPQLPADQAAGWETARRDLSASLDVPTVTDLGLAEELVHLLVRRGDLIRVSNQLVYLPEQIAEVRRLVGTLDEPFGVGEVKGALGLSRKYVMPILEWLDDNDVTIRRPDGRYHGVASARSED